MDSTAVQVEFSLAWLPAELLAAVLCDHSISYTIPNLWKCGSRILNAKLSSCIISLDLVDTAELSTSRWPRLISSLRSLRSLSVNRGLGHLMPSPLLSREIQELPSTLTYLKLISLDVKEGLLLHTAHSTSESPTFVATQYPLGASRMIDLSSLFPQLKVLKLGTDGAPFSDFAGLPSNLTSLKAFGMDLSALPLLPRGLTDLNCSITTTGAKGVFSNDQCTEFILNAPPSLTRLKAILGDLPSTAVEAIPRTVTEGEFGLKTPGRVAAPWKYLFAKALPPNLSSIHVHTVADFVQIKQTWFSVIPSKITKLTLGRSSDRARSLITLSTKAIEALPATLTELCGFFQIDWEAVKRETLMMWPPRLTRLEQTVDYTGRFLEEYPSTLLQLRFAHLASTPLDASLLPPLLTSLDIITEINTKYKHSLNISHTMPETLTRLMVEVARGRECLGISPTLLPTLPRSLRHLNLLIYEDALKPQHLSALSDLSQLQELRADHWRPDWFAALPRNLTSFYVANMLPEPSTAADSSQRPEVLYKKTDMFAALPASLTSLDLGERGKEIYKALSTTSFSTLPHLTSISVSNGYLRLWCYQIPTKTSHPPLHIAGQPQRC